MHIFFIILFGLLMSHWWQACEI